MPGKKLMNIAASEAKTDQLNGWEGFGVGLLAAPLIYGITRTNTFMGHDGRRHLCRGQA